MLRLKRMQNVELQNMHKTGIICEFSWKYTKFLGISPKFDAAILFSMKITSSDHHRPIFHTHTVNAFFREILYLVSHWFLCLVTTHWTHTHSFIHNCINAIYVFIAFEKVQSIARIKTKCKNNLSAINGHSPKWIDQRCNDVIRQYK